MAPTSLRVKDRVDEYRATRGAAPDSPSDDTPEKDETEERLEKILFGDGTGFFDGLTARSTTQQLTIRTGLGLGDTEGLEDGDLDAVADENVCISFVSKKLITLTSFFWVALFPRFWCG